MPESLTKKMLGLPRWAWIAILAGGLTIGLVLRSRQSDEEEIVEEESVGAVGPYMSSDLEAGMTDGFIGDPGYVLTPVAQQSPVIFPDPDLGGFIEDPTDFPDLDPEEPSTLPPGVDAGDINVQVTVDPGVSRDCKKRPRRKPPRGFQWRCINNRWAAVPRKRQGGGKGPDKKDGAGGKKGRGTGGTRPQNRKRGQSAMPRVFANEAVEVITGGGPPPRKNIHGVRRTPSRKRQQQRRRRR